jgi:hypothetical protein
MLQSTMGRYLARAIRSAMLSDIALEHLQLLTDEHSQGRRHHLQSTRISVA